MAGKKKVTSTEKYTAIAAKYIRHNGEKYAPGEEIELTEDEGLELHKLGALKRIGGGPEPKFVETESAE